MAASLEEPDRSRVLHLIHSALTFRNLTTPKANKSFTVPFLAHNNFSQDTERWLRTLVQHHFHHVIPFHPPTTKVREAARNTLRSRLYNYKQWEDHFSTDPSATDMPCSCSHMHTLLKDPTDTTMYDGHCVLTVEDLQLPTHLQLFLQANMNSTFFPTKTQYFRHFHTTLAHWLRHHGLPNSLHQHCHTFLQHQWKQHVASLRHVTQLQQFLTDKLVLHHVDHELQKRSHFLPTALFPRLSHNLEHTTTLPTSSTSQPGPTSHSPYSVLSSQHSQGLPMGIQKTVLYPAQSRLSQTK